MVDSHHPWCVPCYGHLFLYWSKPKCCMVVQHEGLRPPRFWDSLEQVSEIHASGWQSWASFDPPMTYDGRILTLRKGYSADHRTLETKEKAYDTIYGLPNDFSLEWSAMVLVPSFQSCLIVQHAMQNLGPQHSEYVVGIRAVHDVISQPQVSV